MIADLPAPDHVPLPGSPLDLVVWQLQFAEPADVLGPEAGQRLLAALATEADGPFHLARLNPPMVSIALGGAPGAVPGPMEPAPQGWQLRRAELVVTVTPVALSVETTTYGDWATFGGAVRRALEGFASIAQSPPGEQRLGLRYVDRITRPEVERVQAWAEWLQPWLVGPLTHPELGEAVLGLAQQIDWDAGDGFRATVRQRAFHDPERKNRPTVILDFDTFRDGYRAFGVDEVWAATEQLNDISHRLFRAALSESLYQALREESPT